MKNFIAVLLSIVLIFILCSCGNNGKITCYNCGKEVSEDSTYCNHCSCFLADETDIITDEELSTQPTDYSDFGFINNFGMTEFIKIKSYNFDDKNNAYVILEGEGWYNVVSIKNHNYLEDSRFTAGTAGKMYSGDLVEGSQYSTTAYTVVNNRSLIVQPEYSSNKNITITDVKIVKGIPIITFDGMNTPFEEGWNIPAYFLSLENPEVTVVGQKGLSTIYEYKYFIKPELIYGG